MLLETFQENGIKTKLRKTEILLQVCPYCGNSKYNLEVSTTKKVFHCWSCDERGKLRKLLEELNIEYIITDEDTIIEGVKEPQEISLPESYAPLNIPKYRDNWYGEKAWNYILQRNITEESVNTFKIGYCISHNYAGRIIFPVYEDNKLLFFTGRDFLRGKYLKYLHPDVPKSHVIFNWEIAKRQRQIIISEGTIDAISVYQNGYNGAIALFGKQIMKEQIHKILSNHLLKEIIVLLDADCEKESRIIAKKLLVPNIIIKIASLPDGDPNTVSKEVLIKTIEKAKVYKRF